MSTNIRPILGDSITISSQLLQFLRLGSETKAGRDLLVAAGRQYGLSLANQLNNLPVKESEISQVLNFTLGKEGTRLCLVEEVSQTKNGYRVKIRESACSSGLRCSEPNCAFTMGAVAGLLELVCERQLQGRETECVAVNGCYCCFDLRFSGNRISSWLWHILPLS